MVLVDRRRAGRLLIFILVVAALLAYVVAKRPEFRATVDPVRGPGATGGTTPMEPRLGLEREFFADYRADRERSRAQQLELLEQLATDQRADSESRREAGRMIVGIGQRIGQEGELEGLLKARGYQDAVAFLHTQSAEVVLRTQRELDRAELAAIAELVTRTAGIKAQNLAIIPRP